MGLTERVPAARLPDTFAWIGNLAAAVVAVDFTTFSTRLALPSCATDGEGEARPWPWPSAASSSTPLLLVLAEVIRMESNFCLRT